MKCYYCKCELTKDTTICQKCGRSQEISAELLAVAQNGDSEAFEQLYERSYNDVYVTVKAVIKNEDTVQDVMQEVFLQIYMNLKNLNIPEKFSQWAHRIARNRAIDYIRKRKELPFSEMETDENPLEIEDTTTEYNPEYQAERGDTEKFVREILNTLNEEQRAVAGLFYLEDYSIKEIARTLDVSEGAVKGRLYQARQKLKAKAEELEKRGVKLRGVSPVLVIFGWLHSRESGAGENAFQKSFLRIGKKTLRKSAAVVAVSCLVAVAAFKMDPVIAGLWNTPDYAYVEEITRETDDADEDGSVQIPEDAVEYNGHYYKVYYYESVSWTEAKEACEALGGHLVTITSQEEQDFIGTITDNTVWIGAYVDENGDWVWVTGETWSYDNWDEGEPSGGEEQYGCCGWDVDFWNDLVEDSWEQNGFICEWD